LIQFLFFGAIGSIGMPARALTGHAPSVQVKTNLALLLPILQLDCIISGYLKDHNFLKTYSCFMKECSLLHEYYNLVKAGRQPQLTHPHLNLLIILDEWGQYKQKGKKQSR